MAPTNAQHAQLRALLEDMTAPAKSASPGAPDASAPADSGGDGSTAPREVAKAVAFGLRSTQNRPQTAAEMTAKLHKRYEDDDIVEAAVAQLTAVGALDDAAFARAWVDDRGVRRGYGAARLRQELRRRLVPDEIAEEALSALEERDDVSVARDLAARRAATYPASLTPDAVARRLQSYLVRRGYGPSLANRIAIAVSGLDRYRSWD